MNERVPDVRIHDLVKPELPPPIKEIMDAVRASPPELQEDAVLDAAMEQTGLSDFGPEDFRGRLRVLLEAMQEDADLHPFGALTNFNILVRYTVNRLRVEDAYRRHPEIEEVEIRRPIIIAGLPRSGTTHMLNLISSDKRLRSLPYWESLEPLPVPGEEPGADGEDPRVLRCREALEMQDQIMPYFKNMHEMTAEHTHEEIELAGFDFSTMLFENYAIIPAWRDYFLAHDQRHAYRYIKRVLKVLQWQRGPERWILKSPQHMEQLGPLVETFPDATFVLPHRDPLAILISLGTMLSYTARMSREPVRPKHITAYWEDRLHRMLQACVRDHHLLPKERTLDVKFDDFMANDVATVAHIYSLAGHEMTAEVRAAMQNYMRQHPRGRFGRIIYDMEELGIDRDRARELYRFYVEHFGVREEF